ncbi:MAG: phosphoribosylanthranilate isomerase [Spirochaetes bacterium]|nr:phosphoribosylanthranilate isomerase [Spirochaetota bacterium]
MSIFVKVCGIRTREQIDWAVDIGYSAIGVVLYPESARFCPPDHARELADYARGRITSIAVGVTHDEVAACYDDFDFVQIYEYRDDPRCIYAGTGEPPGRGFPFFIYDSSRGTGRFDDLPSWLHGFKEKLVISGGLTPDNVAAAIKAYRPYGVDVSSGVEIIRGVKDRGLMHTFMNEVTHAIK